jgi:hypothetical protein
MSERPEFTAHVSWRNGASLCGYTGIVVEYETWHQWVLSAKCERCLDHSDLPLLILEYLP